MSATLVEGGRLRGMKFHKGFENKVIKPVSEVVSAVGIPVAKTVASIVAPEFAPAIGAFGVAKDAIQKVKEGGALMGADGHGIYHGGGMGSFWQSPATANAATELFSGRYVDGTPVGGSMADIHYHLDKTNTYDRRPNLKKYNERPPNHGAHNLMLKHHFDYEKRGGGFGQDHTGETGFTQMMDKQKMGASKDIVDVAGKAAQVIGSLI